MDNKIKCRFQELTCECNIGNFCMVETYNNKNITFKNSCGDKFFYKELKDVTIDIFNQVFDKHKVLEIAHNEMRTQSNDNDSDNNEYIIIEIIDSHHGTYIPKFVCENFGILECQDKYDENYYNDFNEVENKLNNIINDWLHINKYHFYLNYSENGDYCLMMSEA